MTSGSNVARRLGNKLYEVAFPLYRPLYSAFKAYADRAERRLVASKLSPGSVVVDAGANIGIYSRFLALCVGDAGAVHSFEPSPDNFRRLRAAVSDLSNVHANQVAVSDTTGEQLLYISDTLNVDHRTYAVDGEARRTVPVRFMRLDDYFQPKQRVDLIKLDIQGFELNALRGATRVLSENPDIKILFELWPHGLRAAGNSPEELLIFLKQCGFTLFAFGRNELQEYQQPPAFSYDSAYFLNIFAERVTEPV